MNESSTFEVTTFEPVASGNTTNYQLPFGLGGIIVASVTLIPMAIFGILGNGLTIFVILKSPRLKKSIFNLFIASLCVSDLISATISPLFLYRRTWGYLKFELPNFLCSLFWSLDNATSIVTSLHILCFSGLRFVSLLSPHSYSRINKKHAMIFIAVIWATAILCGCIPFAIWFDALEIDRTVPSRILAWPACTLKLAWINEFRLYTLVGYSIFFYIPMILITILSVAIGIALLRKRRTREKTAKGKIQTQGNDEKESKRQLKENRALYQLSLIVGSFMLGYIPHTGFHIFATTTTSVTQTDHIVHWWFGELEYVFLRFSESLNPVFYNMASSKMREETVNCLKKIFGIKQIEPRDMTTSVAVVTKATSAI